MKLFLNKDKPIVTRKEKNCEACDVISCIKQDFGPRQWMLLFCVFLPSIVLGGIGLFRYSLWSLFLWILCLCGYFAYLAALVKGRRGEKASNSKDRSSSEGEKAVLFFGMVVNALLPAFFMILSQDDLFLVMYTLCLIVGFAVPTSLFCMRRSACIKKREYEE